MKDNSETALMVSPGEAAKYLNEIITESAWGIINVILNELQQFVSYFKAGWYDEIVSDFIRILVDCKNNLGNSYDLITSLSKDSYLIITRQEKIQLWQDELNKRFTSLVLDKIPNTLISGQDVVVIADEVFPVPSLVFGSVRPRDGKFLQLVDVYQAVLDNRKKNERANVWFRLNSLLYNRSQLKEELLMANASTHLHSLVSVFSAITTGHLHDIRNGLNILAEQYLRLEIPGEKTREIQNSIQFIHFLLETISEIRFRGTGALEKTDIHHLVSEMIDSFQSGINHNIDFADIDQTVMVYTKPQHIIQSLFVLLFVLKIIVKDKSTMTIMCGISDKSGFIEIKGEFNAGINTIVTDESGAFDVDEYWPYVYIFTKIIRRLQGSLEVNPDSIFIFLPLYEYQDKLSLQSIKKQCDELKSEIAGITDSIKKETGKEEGQTLPADALELANPLLHKLIKALDEFIQMTTGLATATEDPENILEMLLAGSRYCMLLAANLLSHKGKYFHKTEKTDVKKVLALVQSILHYRLSRVAEYELSFSDTLPDVHAAEMALAQVIMNLVMNSLEELARVKPPVPRLYISAKEENNHVVISIIDTGTGIPDDVMHRIMNSKPGVGMEMKSGIGLFVVKSIIDLFGAGLEFKVHPDKGTTVRILLRKWEAAE